MKIPAHKLKRRLSEYLHRAAAGEEFIVTVRDREIARLSPPRARHHAVSQTAEAIARFRSLPWVRPGNGQKRALPPPLVRIGVGEKSLAEIVGEQRG